MSFLCTMNFLFVGLLVTPALSDLTQIPRTTETKTGEKTWLNCSTSLSTSIHWNHREKLVYAGGSLFEPYFPRFSMEVNVSAGSYNLVLSSVESTDSGEYKCQEDEGLGAAKSAQLIVLESDPICPSNLSLSQIIGFNDCGMALYNIVLTCEVTYYGNIHPELVWRKSQTSSIITDGIKVQNSGHKLKYILTMMADESFNNTAFVCETTRSAGKQYGCATEPIKILPACNKNPAVMNVVVSAEVVCFVNFTQSCSYKWLDANNFTISNDTTLKPNEVGKYRCEATCFVRNDYFTVVAMVAEVSSNDKAGGGQFLWMLLWLLLVIFILAAIIAVFLYVCRKRKIPKSKTRLPDSAALLKLQNKQKDIPTSAEANEHDGRTFSAASPELHDQQEVEITEAKKNDDETRWTSDPQLIEKFTTSEPNKKTYGISGIAIAGNELYITRFQTPLVKVYTLATGKENRNFTVEGLVSPWDLVYSKTKRCLYIMDFRKLNHLKKIIIQLDLNGAILHSWSTEKDYGYISVAFDSNVVLASYGMNRIIEYTENGNFVRNIQLSNDNGFEHPRHAVKLPKDEFLVSHGDKDDLLHRVCKIDASGNVLMKFGGERGSNYESLYAPIYMAVDSSGSILLIDRDNSRVLLLDSNLKFKRELIPRGMGGMDRPERMAVDEKTGRLFITHNPDNWRNCSVFVFKFG